MRSCSRRRSSRKASRDVVKFRQPLLTLFAIACLLNASPGIAQLSIPESLPPAVPAKPIYIFPISPGTTALLAGTMGELRSTHFHAGIDIRTNNMIGLPVLAAQDGYISRAIVSSYGYGRLLFVQHSNGTFTAYAHLDKFKGPLADYVRNAQYKQKSFETDISLAPGQYPVKAGDTIAFSGNTGGSTGPHLHFEIRDSLNRALNPLSFGFPEVKDTSPPVAQKIALKTLDANSRINDRFGRFEFYLYKTGNHYTFAAPILAHGKIGIELLAYDKMDMSGFKCGINDIQVFADSVPIFSQTIEKISFSGNRSIVPLLDYPSLRGRSLRFNKLYIDDGGMTTHHTATDHGFIYVDHRDVAIRIALQDTYGNSADVRFALKASPVTAEATLLEPMIKPYAISRVENTLVVSLKARAAKHSDSIVLIGKRDQLELRPAYYNANQAVYLHDLRKLIPDSIRTSRGTIPLDNADAIPSGAEYKFYSDIADIRFTPYSLYDTLYLNVARDTTKLEVFTIGDANDPLQGAIHVLLKPQRKYITDRKSSVYLVNGPNIWLGGEWRNGRIGFQTSELGAFTILRDTVGPSIRMLRVTKNGVRFRVKDNLSGIARMEATLNGQWVLMNYDYKTDLLESDPSEKSLPFKGDFQLKVVDMVGNETIFQQKIQ